MPWNDMSLTECSGQYTERDHPPHCSFSLKPTIASDQRRTHSLLRQNEKARAAGLSSLPVVQN